VSKGELHINGIDRQSRAGMRVEFDAARYLEGCIRAVIISPDMGLV
jgi:hypothetical protein